MAKRHLFLRVYEAVKTVLLLGLLLALAGIGAWSAIRGRGPLAGALVAREECRQDYARAHTRADSAAVDNHTPVVSKGQAAFAKSCAVMRADGDFGTPPRR